MAIALVNHTGSGSTDGNTVTTTAVSMSGAKLLVAFVVSDGGVAAPTPTDSSSNTWTGLTAQVGNFGRGQWWYAKNATVSSSHTASVSTTSGFPAICFLGFSGADTVSPFDVENGAGSATAVTSLATGSITPGQANELVLAGLMLEGGIAGLAIDGTGFTITDQVAQTTNLNYGANAAYKVQTTATAENRTWSWTTAQACAAAIASFKAAVAATQQQLMVLGCGP